MHERKTLRKGRGEMHERNTEGKAEKFPKGKRKKRKGKYPQGKNKGKKGENVRKENNSKYKGNGKCKNENHNGKA